MVQDPLFGEMEKSKEQTEDTDDALLKEVEEVEDSLDLEDAYESPEQTPLTFEIQPHIFSKLEHIPTKPCTLHFGTLSYLAMPNPLEQSMEFCQ
uniref:GON-4-like protein n=1 Tax=Haemonchus contortus TaxID=6289 RepID=A0A7I4Z2K0_HAECO